MLATLAWALPAGRAASAAMEAPKPAAAGPGAAAKPVSTAEELFPAAVRNPFVKVEGTGQRAGPGANGLVPAEEFSIYGLVLKGVMEDRSGAGSAILTDPKYGASFVLRRGKLYDSRNKPVPGVTGKVKARQRTVELVGRDRERRLLTMNEREEDQENSGPR